MEPALELSVKADVEPALTVFEESADALIRVVPPFFGPWDTGKVCQDKRDTAFLNAILRSIVKVVNKNMK